MDVDLGALLDATRNDSREVDLQNGPLRVQRNEGKE